METKDYLIAHGIKASIQRIVVMDYLLTHKTHPSIGQIYKDLLPVIPSLSKTTLYNMLKLFAQKKVALQLQLDEKNLLFDGDVRPHAHFQCLRCGKVFDIFSDTLPEIEAITRNKIGDLTIVSTDLSYHGYCKKCSEQMLTIPEDSKD